MTFRSPLAILALSTAALVATGCGGDSAGPSSPTAGIADELRESGFGDFLGVQDPSRTEQSGAWTYLFYDPAEEGAICLEGKPYQVSVHRGTTNQVLLYLEGGGACWDYLTCRVLGTAKREANGAPESGIIDFRNPANPFRDWNIVYASYCDGSVFTGDGIADYQGNRTFHHGLQNLSAAVTAAVEAFPDPDRIVVAGSSAGGYGTFAGYAVTRVAYPDTEILSFNDSGPGLQNPDASEDVQNRIVNWEFTKRIPESCTRCSEQYTYLYDWTFERDPLARVSLYSFQQDGTISGFLDLSGPAYFSLMLDVTGEVHDAWPDRFRRFFPVGRAHTVLEIPLFYSLSVDGVSIRDWTQAFLDDSPGWQEVIE